MAGQGTTEKTKRVVYLFGAGASHGCVKAVGSDRGILMQDLSDSLAKSVRKLVEDDYQEHKDLLTFVNEVIDPSADYEHVITFLDQSVSAVHRKLAGDLRKIFETVLREKLDLIADELGGPPVGLYEALLDMYKVPRLSEELAGIITINYDDYIERAAESAVGRAIDFGIGIRPKLPETDSLRILKLHGSFGWKDAWPISREFCDTPLWIPPGIQKTKDRYPFNVLWGLAREMLDCEILRIVGCKLGANDWDLISLLFSTRNVNSSGRRYDVEVIDSPKHAIRLREAYPYLGIKSILEIAPIGKQLVSEFGGGEPREFESLSLADQGKVLDRAGSSNNWFRLWLKQMAESIYTELGSVETELGRFEALLEAY